MTAGHILRRLVSGAQLEPGEVLHNARMHVGGVELYGDEEILAHFAANPFAGDLQLVEGDRLAVLHCADEAVFAEFANDHVTRLWLVGPGAPPVREPSVSVPFDVDLRQSAGGILFETSDHPDLVPADIARLLAVGPNIARACGHVAEAVLLRARPLCLRAFSAGGEVAALFALSLISGRSDRISGFVYVIAVLNTETRVIIDLSGWRAVESAAWRPAVA